MRTDLSPVTRYLFISLLILCLGNRAAIAQSTDYSDSTITVAASDKYHAQFLGRIFLGNHYRKVWSAPISIHYLDLEHDEGGLVPLKQGGGLQTKSLRLESADSNQYVIRTIDKDPSRTVSAVFQNTIVTDLIQDQISASHPYAFMVVPALAHAANIYHSNPKVLWVPDDPNLGAFRDAFKNRMVMFEDRKLSSAGVEEGLSGFVKVKDTRDVFKAIHKDGDNRVDEKFLLRSRLFDMLIGDWDRHEDQWQWAQFNLPSGGKLFRPIPRDRDQAFFNFDGILPTIASINVTATRKMQRFSAMPFSVKWFNYNGRFIDHNLITELTRDDWQDMADSMLLIISDADIENAFKALPDTIYKLSAPSLIKTLEHRRDNLPLIAENYYRFLAKTVVVAGTSKRDLFEVERKDPDITDVSVFDYRKGKKGDLFYHRTFYTGETKEIQLYGLDAGDVFQLNGKSVRGSLVRIIGGDGNDSIVDQSKVTGWGKRTRVYDSQKGNYLILGSEGRDKTSDNKALNNFSIRNSYYNSNMFYPRFGYSADDGVFIGASILRLTYGFRKGICDAGENCTIAPYQSRQVLGFDIATNTGAFNFYYNGDFPAVFGNLGLNIAARLQAPDYRYNFFGFGNESTINDSISLDDYRLRINQAYLFPALVLGKVDKMRLLFGPLYRSAKVLETADSVFLDRFPDLNAGNLSLKHFYGGGIQFNYEPFTQDTMPLFQVRFNLDAGYLQEVEHDSVGFAFLHGYVACYYNIYSKRHAAPLLTLATRLGGGTNLGNFEFYQANTIGGRTHENVRGYLGERFAGRTAIYNNLEARLRLFHFNAYIFPADFGVIGLVDNGLVIADNQSSSAIHTGYGGGIWLNPFSMAVVTATYTVSPDQDHGLFNLKLGWWF